MRKKVQMFTSRFFNGTGTLASTNICLASSFSFQDLCTVPVHCTLEELTVLILNKFDWVMNQFISLSLACFG